MLRFVQFITGPFLIILIHQLSYRLKAPVKQETEDYLNP